MYRKVLSERPPSQSDRKTDIEGGPDTRYCAIRIIPPPFTLSGHSLRRLRSTCIYPEVLGGGVLVLAILLIPANHPELVLHSV